VIDPHPGARHKRNQIEIIARLERAAQGTPAEVVLQFVQAHPGALAPSIVAGTGLAEAPVAQSLGELISANEVVSLDGERAPAYLSRATWEQWRAKIARELRAFHDQWPLRAGMPREELKSRLNLESRLGDAAVARAVSEGLIRETDKTVALSDHRVVFDPATTQAVQELIAVFERDPYSPPSVGQAEAAVGSAVLNALVEQGTLERISPSVLLLPGTVESMQTWVVAFLQREGEVTAAQLRDQFGSSRKYAIAFLEYLDSKRVTKRVGDARVLR
jgi:selenocysteine-specific elongation factor